MKNTPVVKVCKFESPVIATALEGRGIPVSPTIIVTELRQALGAERGDGGKATGHNKRGRKKSNIQPITPKHPKNQKRRVAESKEVDRPSRFIIPSRLRIPHVRSAY